MEKKARKFQPEMNLRSILPKTQWGSRAMSDKNGLLCLRENEFIASVGSRLVTFDNSSNQHRKTHLVEPYNINALNVYLMSLSPDSRFLLALVRFKDDDNNNTVNMLIYQTENKLQDAGTKRPRLIKYVNTSYISSGDEFAFQCVTFSHDSVYIACGTNVPSKGVIIYDHFRELIVQTVSTDSSPCQVSFNPLDSSKICTVGENGLFKFWRFTEKSVHAAPVSGLKTGNFAFKCHRWVTAVDGGVVVAGTDNGNLFVIQSCAQKAPIVSAFGPNDVLAVENILIRGDIVFVVSGLNCIAAFEIRKVLVQKGANVLASNLVPIAKYRMTNVECITGIQWLVKESLNAFGIICTTNNNIFQHEILSDSDLAGVGLPKHEDTGPLAWTEITQEKVLHNFHKANVHTIALSTQSNTFVTGSFEDSTIRYWDFNNPYSTKACELTESFIEKPDENPFHLDLHPSGLFVVTACEYEVREYAITDSQLEIMRKISVKLPFTGPNGVPYLVTQPVSIVRYSHGGQFLAVVTGKLAQIFHLFNKDFSSTNMYGSYVRVMILCDHISPITDLKFLRDDNTIITTSTDGSVYSWVLGAQTRESEYVCKGVPSTLLAISKSRDTKDATIVAVFENQAEEVAPLATVAVKLRRQSSIVNRKSSISRTNTGLGLLGTLSPLDIDPPNSPTKSVQMSTTSIVPKRKCFLAVWTGKLSLTPKLVYVDSPVRAICLGDTDGVDKYEICVIGLDDGRILISVLPFPVKIVDTFSLPGQMSKPGTPQEGLSRSGTGGISTTSSIHLSRPSLLHAAGSVKKAKLVIDTISEGMSKASDRSDQMSVGSFSNSSKVLEVVGEANSVSGNSVPSTPMGERSGTAGGGGGGSVVSSSSVAGLTHANSNNKLMVTTVGGDVIDVLDESRCKVMRLHYGSVNQVVISANGMWIFSAGADGTIFLLATSKRAFDYQEIPEQPESIENRYLIVDKKKLYALKKKLLDIETNTDQAKKDNDMMIAKIIESKEKKENDLRLKMKTEINKRDEAIMLGRREYLQLKNIMKSQIDKIHKEAQDKISDLELVYEKKLSQESLYLDKMKQAYDEYVIHTRMDLAEQQKKSTSRIESIENDKLLALKDAEKQKSAVLQYMEYLKVRNEEVLNSLEEQQVNERYKLRQELANVNKTLSDTVNAQFSETVLADLQVSKLKIVIDNHQQEEMKLKSSVEWANNRIMQLEESLKNATTSLAIKEDYNSKWEFRTGELQQKIVELEKIRKALTSQLQTIREELGPKDETLTKVTEKLHEMEREYELSLHALAEKEKEITHKGISIGLLQKQVRDLRNTANRKDQVLRRSSTLFDQYKHALQQAYFVSEKRTKPSASTTGGNNKDVVEAGDTKKKEKSKTTKGGSGTGGDEEVVEIIAQNQGMKVAMKRLNDILNPYLGEGNNDSEIIEEAEQVQIEQERHMTLLHSNVSGLRANLDVVNKVAATKVHNHLSDNQHLLKEVNSLRLEVRSISMENQRLQAQLEFNATQKSHKDFLANQQQHKEAKANGTLHHQNSHNSNNNGGGVGGGNNNNNEPSHKYARIPPESERNVHTPTNRNDLEAQQVKNFLMDNIEKSLLTISLQESAQYIAGGSHASPQGTGTLGDPSFHARVQSAPQPHDPTQSMNDLNHKLNNLSLTTGSDSKPLTVAERKIAALIEMNLHDIQATNERAAEKEFQYALAAKQKGGAGIIGGGKKRNGGNTGHTKMSDEILLNMNSYASDGSLGTSQSSIQLGTAKFSLPPVHSNNAPGVHGSSSAKQLRR